MDKDKEFQKHEDTCERCGRCCRVKIQWFDGSIRLGDYCEFYDREKRECMCYDQRFLISSKCRTILGALQEGGLPPDCPYVRDFPGYVTHVQWEKKDENVN